MSDGAVLGKSCIAVCEHHGVVIERRADLLVFKRGNESPVMFSISEEEYFEKPIVRRLQRGFKIPIFCFYNTDECKPNCMRGA